MKLLDAFPELYNAKLWLDYTNWKGVRSERIVIAKCVRHGVSKYHPGPDQYFLEAYDLDRKVDREFAIKDIHNWRKIENE